MAMEWFDAVSISEVYNRLFVGGYIQASKLPYRNPHKIEAVLDVSTEPPYEEAPDVVYAHIPFDDGNGIPRAKFFACMEFLFEQYSQGKNVLVHCAAGISRSVTIAISFLVYAKIMGWKDAYDQVRRKREIANPHVDVMNSAKKWLQIWPYDGSFGHASPNESGETKPERKPLN